jgi:hypothetical protein
MTNIAILTIVLTNWVSIPGDYHRENGSNFVHERLVISTNTYLEQVEVIVRTNRMLLLSQPSTNTAFRWEFQPTLPPLPNHSTKE